MTSIASIEVSATFNLPAIAAASGSSDRETREYREGRLYVSGVTQEALEAALAEYVHQEPRAEPPALTPRQLRLMMLQVGLTDSQVEAAIDNIADPAERAAARIEWTWATTYRRDHPLVAYLATVLGFSDEELDTLWTYAADL